MANTLTPIDVYELVNEIAKEATGQKQLQAVDTTTFVSVGETLLRMEPENTLNVISSVLARTIFSIRPYKSSLDILVVDTQRWGGQVRKIVPLYKGAEASEDYNTDLNPTKLADGQSVDMYKINKPEAIQLNFYGTKKLQKHITRFRDQLAIAFRSEEEFIAFISAIMTEFDNEIELVNESKKRGTLLNFMAGIYAMGLEAVDLAELYNTRYATAYTRDELLGTYLPSFMKFVASKIKKDSNALRDMSTKRHAQVTGVAPILRHTPKAMQRMVMYEPFFIDTDTQVMPDTFNPEYLNIGDYEGVNFWQSQDDPTAINIKPNILDVATGNSADAESTVELDYVLGMLYDVEALGVLPQFDYTSATPFNSAGGYSNIYVHWRFNQFNDFTENAILYYIGKGGEVSGGE